MLTKRSLQRYATCNSTDESIKYHVIITIVISFSRKSEWHGKQAKQVAVVVEKLREGGVWGEEGSSSVSSSEIVDKKLVDERGSLLVALHGGLAGGSLSHHGRYGKKNVSKDGRCVCVGRENRKVEK